MLLPEDFAQVSTVCRSEQRMGSWILPILPTLWRVRFNLVADYLCRPPDRGALQGIAVPAPSTKSARRVLGSILQHPPNDTGNPPARRPPQSRSKRAFERMDQIA